MYVEHDFIVLNSKEIAMQTVPHEKVWDLLLHFSKRTFPDLEISLFTATPRNDTDIRLHSLRHNNKVLQAEYFEISRSEDGHKSYIKMEIVTNPRRFDSDSASNLYNL